ncbi:hypothetical protein MNBD_BACTEROID05-555, partial [hydrothermal vent metagenome]
MKFNDFKSQHQKYPLIFSRDIQVKKEDLQKERNQLNRWVNNGLIIRLKRGVYSLNKQDRRIVPDAGYIANHLYEPSYISLEYALTFYGLIPEETKDVTSISTRKTMSFENEFGNFIYQHIKPSAFRGFKKMGSGAFNFFMAEAEKALVDFLYLHLAEFSKDIKNRLENFYRFQNLDELNQEKLMKYGLLF